MCNFPSFISCSDIDKNSLTGILPPQIGALRALETLWVVAPALGMSLSLHAAAEAPFQTPIPLCAEITALCHNAVKYDSLDRECVSLLAPLN